MTDDPTGTVPPLVSHVSVGIADLGRARLFYDAIMRPLGARLIAETSVGLGYGRRSTSFWAARPHDNGAASVGNGAHVCLNADTPENVVAFHKAGLASGGLDDGLPGPRPEYAPGYYAAFLRDPDGNRIEAMCWIDARP